MATPSETIWEIEPHTLSKHRILRSYLGAWIPILSSYHGRIVYLDGFSGPGIYKGGEPGSPIIALDVALRLRSPITGEPVFIFVDERPDRIANLQKEISKLNVPKNFVVHAETGHFADITQQILDDLDKNGKTLAPTFAFADPFGFSGLPFEMLKRLLQHPRSEALITFMVDSINRFLEAPNDQIRNHIVRFFGTDEVLDVASAPGDRIENLTSFYLGRLSTLGNYVRRFEMCDSAGRTIYHLCFVTKHPLGHVRMKEAMWKEDEEGDFRFSDRTNPNQDVLFHQDHSDRILTQLKSKFGTTTTRVGLLRDYVNNETAYLEKHLRSSLDKAEKSGQITVDQKKLDGSRRRRGTYTDDVLVTFTQPILSIP